MLLCVIFVTILYSVCLTLCMSGCVVLTIGLVCQPTLNVFYVYESDGSMHCLSSALYYLSLLLERVRYAFDIRSVTSIYAYQYGLIK